MKHYLWAILCLSFIGVGCNSSKSVALPINSPPNTVVKEDVAQLQTFGMQKYENSKYGFSFWYPKNLKIIPYKKDSEPFPGGVLVESMYIGAIDGPNISVVESISSSITDQPIGHASPISQTKYFYDKDKAQWMVAYPEDAAQEGRFATTTADVSKKTIGGLTMLPTGLRFDANIIPLNTNLFLVIRDGGTGLAPSLAKTVSLLDFSVPLQDLSKALQEEAAAFSGLTNEENVQSKSICQTSNDSDLPLDNNKVWVASQYFNGMKHGPTIQHVCKGQRELFYLQMDWDDSVVLHRGYLVSINSSSTRPIASKQKDPDFKLLISDQPGKIRFSIDDKIFVFDEKTNLFVD